jgi:hypothetical protein
MRNIATLLGETRDGFRGYWFPLSTSVLHKVVAPAWLPSRELPSGSARLVRLPASFRSSKTESHWYNSYTTSFCTLSRFDSGFALPHTIANESA